jgi:hypothetical protein
LKLALLRGVNHRPKERSWWRGLCLELKIGAKDRRFAREVERVRSAQPTVRERQQELIRFYLNYETHVEVICDLGTCGPTPSLEASYRSSREWMIKNYPDVRRYVIAYLKYSAEDAQQSIDLSGNPADAFEALFTAPTLREFLEHDDGEMIDRINRTREALTMYGHHLRLLASNQ